MLTYMTFEVRRTMRNLPFALYTIIFPLGFYLLFTSVFRAGAQQNNPFAAHYMVSMALYATIGTGLTGIGSQIAFERRGGWTRQLALTPLKPLGYLGIKVGSALLLTGPVILLILVAGRVINGVQLPITSWLMLIPLLWLASLPFTALGIAIGYTFRDEASNGITIILLFLFSIAGGLWIPLQIFPSGMRDFAQALPSYRGAELGWRVVDGHDPFAAGSLIFVAWLLACFVLAGWRFRKSS
jgi:ABC-2 type transport system permease protein